MIHSKKNINRNRVLVGIYAFCFLVAACNHLNDFRVGGWLPYTYAPIYLNIFWTAHIFFYLIIIFLLFWRVKSGILLAVIVVEIGLFVNVPYFFISNNFDNYGMFILLSQIVFTVFIIITAPVVFMGEK
jgi:hypothetical protein